MAGYGFFMYLTGIIGGGKNTTKFDILAQVMKRSEV